MQEKVTGMSDDSYLRWLVSQTPTRWWHDSGDPQELERALAQGATGVTTNPVLTYQALRANPDYWRERVGPLDAHLTPEERAIKLMQVVARQTAARLEPIYQATSGAEGYVCAQVNPAKAGDREGMLSMARRFNAWAPNIAVKLPVTAAGLDVLEECTALGITVTATVSFTVPQVIAVAERHRLGTLRAEAAGVLPGRCFPVIMIGRLDDYLREVAADNCAGLSEAEIRQAGLAVTKRAYQIFKEQAYTAVLLVAALRGAHHMTGLAGGELIMSIHPKIQTVLLAPGVPQLSGIDQAVDPQVIERLSTLRDFCRAYEPDGLLPEEFISFGVTQRTLATFLDSAWVPLQEFNL
jgi:transaldolase